MLEPNEILFMGLGTSAVLWYRCALPAIHMGADWVGIQGSPPGVQVVTGLVHGETTLPRYEDYRLVIMQEPYGTAWLRQIRSLRDRGIKVLYEIDDYIHGVAKQRNHDFARYYTKERIKASEICMRACDGIVCATDYIARRYAKFNRNIYVCRNGIDIGRYALTRPERPTVNIVWAGATGHMDALIPWANEVLDVMRERKNVCFISIGEPGLATAMNTALSAERAIGIPFAPLECYPAAMTLGDIAIAPAGKTTWYRGKSDLRWLEASALKIPLVADPIIYDEIEEGVTGLLASTPAEAGAAVRRLIDDRELRERIGEAAHGHVLRERTSDIAAGQWFEICAAVCGEYESVSQLQRA